MKQVIQNLKNGLLEVADVPAPGLARGMIRVQNAASAISSGTERMVVELAQKSLAGKAKERPDLVKKVLKKLAREGLGATIKAVMARLDRNVPLGYSCAGVVDAVGPGVDDFRPGERVACAGAGYANHAEFVCVPKNLVVRVPDAVTSEEAAFTTIGAVAMHGFRMAETTLGETVVVIGLGLVGQFAVQVARAAGMKVIAVDLDESKVDLALMVGGAHAGAVVGKDNVAAVVSVETGGVGADAVIVAAAAKSSAPAQTACELARDRGRIVVVGAVQMDLDRNLLFAKELSVTVSRSYGPGRYDPDYEEKGFDYPAGYVRWTEGRNLQEVADLMGRGQLHVKPLITHTFEIAHAMEAYDLITGKTEEAYVGVVLTYPGKPEKAFSVPVIEPRGTPPREGGKVGVTLVGAGNFARSVLVPALEAVDDVALLECVTAHGPSAVSTAKRYGFARAGGDFAEAIARDDVDVVVIATPHDEHAGQAAAALRAGKHVFLEKPIAITREGLDDVAKAFSESGRALMVGYNRRFAPATGVIKDFFNGRGGPLSVLYRVNAGPAPQGAHWLADLEKSGGRILGEVCHFVDWMIAVTGALPRTVYAQAMAPGAPGSTGRDDVMAVIRFEDDSLGTVAYNAGGSGAVEKEYAEVTGNGKTAILVDFKEVRLFGGKKADVVKYRTQQKGHREEMAAFIAAVAKWGGEDTALPIPAAQLFASSHATLAMVRSAGGEGLISI